jgi:hypothetical protein
VNNKTNDERGEKSMNKEMDILAPSYYWKGGIDVIEFAKDALS